MWLEYVRDIAIILLALESLVIGILLLITMGRLRELERILREEVQPVLQSLQDTMHTVRGTAHIVSDTVVNPLVRFNSFSTGAMQAFKYFFTFGHRKDSAAAAGDQAQEHKEPEAV
ncbi:MAG: hypothetical protein LLG44_05220 [Chloroflexi bacterium]|nr:hypothetical protein [Chloroflexota bacterium]